MQDIDSLQTIVELYIASSRQFTQLSSAALVLTIIFNEKILGVNGPIRITWSLISSWFFFLLTIAFSTLYEYLSIQFLSKKMKLSLETSYFPGYFEGNPGFFYGLMVFSFFIAALLFIFSAIQSLRKPKSN